MSSCAVIHGAHQGHHRDQAHPDDREHPRIHRWGLRDEGHRNRRRHRDEGHRDVHQDHPSDADHRVVRQAHRGDQGPDRELGDEHQGVAELDDRWR